jgi:hypothetical protein
MTSSQGRQPVHPRETDVFTHPVRVGAMEIAVDRAGCLVLHVPEPGSFTITNLDGVIADLELARAHARMFERNPERCRPAVCCDQHAPDGEAERCCDRCPDILPTVVVDPTAGRQCCPDHAPVETIQCCEDCPDDDSLTPEEMAEAVAASMTPERRAEIVAAAEAAAAAIPLGEIDAMVNNTLTDDELVGRLALVYLRTRLDPVCPTCKSGYPHVRDFVGDQPCDDSDGWHAAEPSEEDVAEAREDVRRVEVEARADAAPRLITETIDPGGFL